MGEVPKITWKNFYISVVGNITKFISKMVICEEMPFQFRGGAISLSNNFYHRIHIFWGVSLGISQPLLRINYRVLFSGIP